MSWTDEHLKWLENTGEVIKTTCGKEAPVYHFNHDITNNEILSAWAKHFRNHYCSDSDLAVLKPEEMTNSIYLLELKFPDVIKKPGPSIRAGDFAEILVADYLEFLRAYYVPRTRYDRKIIGNESSKGSDVIAFKQLGDEPSNKDELLIYEVKAKLSGNKPSNVLQAAIDDSSKDEIRIAESLNAMKQRLHDKSDTAGVATIDRFQKNIDQPYKRFYGAAAVITNAAYCTEKLSESDTSNHVSHNELELLVITGEQLMPLVHALYKRAADEA